MGLDMYLNKYISIPVCRHDDNWLFDIIAEYKGNRLPINTDKVTAIKEELCYWRKAHTIHNWFVQNAQDGIDDCKEHWVSEDKLYTLYDICKQVIKYRDKAENGLTEEDRDKIEELFDSDYSETYDEYFFNQIEDTIDALEQDVIGAETGGSYVYYTYESSW